MKAVFKLIGDVLKVDGNKVLVKTLRRLRQRVDEDINLVTISSDQNVKEGNRMLFAGKMENSIDDPEVKLMAHVVEPKPKSAGYKNVALIVGKIHSMDPFPAKPKEKKPAFTNVCIVSGENDEHLFNGTAFRGLARKWAEQAHVDRGIDAYGHLQRRPMIDTAEQKPLLDADGNPRYAVEIICRDATKNKLHEYVEVDEFAELEDKPAKSKPANAKAV